MTERVSAILSPQKEKASKKHKKKHHSNPDAEMVRLEKIRKNADGRHDYLTVFTSNGESYLKWVRQELVPEALKQAFFDRQEGVEAAEGERDGPAPGDTVGRILGCRMAPELEFYVHWKGRGLATWTSNEQLRRDAPHALLDFYQSRLTWEVARRIPHS